MIKKLWSAIKGASNERGQEIIDSQLIRILDQELREAEKELNDSKTSLATMMGNVKSLSRDVAVLEGKVTEHEGYVMQALDKEDEELAADIAGKISELEEELNVKKQARDQYKVNVETLKKQVKETGRSIQGFRRERDMVQTTEQIQNAQAATASRFSGTTSSLSKAAESLTRKKDLQQKKADQMSAAADLEAETSGSGLEEKMRSAGIGVTPGGGKDVLARLKAKRSSGEG